MTRVYADSDQFVDVFTQLFDRIEEANPRALDGVAKRSMVVQFRVHEPEAEMWVDGHSKPVRVSFGAAGRRATLGVELTGDTLHELLLGTLPLGRALSGRRMHVKGSKLKAMRLQDLFHAFQSEYPALAAELLGDRG
jgi:hypothetical protein